MQVLGLSGALRRGSTNSMLLREAARIGGLQLIEGNLRLPLYDGDDEDAHGIPDDVLHLHGQIAQAPAVLIATPEYNSGISGVLKNALDWVSRHKTNPWAGKPVAIMSAAAGRSGGARAQYALRLALAPFRPIIVPGPEVMVADCRNQFDAEGRLIAESYVKAVAGLMEALRAEVALRG